MSKRVAVILSGSGVYDGAELHESVLCLLALDRVGAEVTVLAPDIDQAHVVDHQVGAPSELATRNVLVESARIARGPVTPLGEADARGFDAVLMPGGFGAAKNLCTWAFDGAECSVDPDVERFLRAMHDQGSWIGACCIAPVILAKLFGDLGVEVTIGQGEAEHAEVEKTGAKHIKLGVQGVHRDAKRRVITTPAYMEAQRIADLPTGINELVRQLMEA